MRTVQELELQPEHQGGASARAAGRLPVAPLLALAMAGFITVLTEALPAGLLPPMARGLAISTSIARDFGGSLSATNVSGGGAQFTLTLVRAEVTSATPS